MKNFKRVHDSIKPPVWSPGDGPRQLAWLNHAMEDCHQHHHSWLWYFCRTYRVIIKPISTGWRKIPVDLQGKVTMGVPVQRMSIPVVWPLQRGVSKQRSANCPLRTCSSLAATLLNTTLELSTPFSWQNFKTLLSPCAGNLRSHKTLLAVLFKICKNDNRW